MPEDCPCGSFENCGCWDVPLTRSYNGEDARRPRMTRSVELDLSDVLEIRVHEGTGLVRPWWGTMTHGIGHVGEAGAGVWRAHTRKRLIRKMAAYAARRGFDHGSPTCVLIEVRNS